MIRLDLQSDRGLQYLFRHFSAGIYGHNSKSYKLNLKQTDKRVNFVSCVSEQNFYFGFSTHWPRVIKIFSCSTQHEFFPVGILTFRSRKNSILGLSSLKNAELLDIFILMSI